MLFALAAFLSGQAPAKPKSPWLGVWSGRLGDQGIVALDIGDQGTGEPKTVAIWWLIEELRPGAPPRFENDTVFIQRLNHKGQGADGLAFRLIAPNQIKLVPYGVLPPPLDPLLEGLTLTRPSGSNPWYDITNNYYKTSEWGKWHEGGTLKPVPPDWPAVIAMPTAALLSRSVHEFHAALVQATLPPAFLAEAYAWTQEKPGWGDQKDYILQAIARNPNTATETLERIWADPDNPQLWIAVASHSKTRPEWRLGLVDRIMAADQRVKSRATWSGDGPPELYLRLAKDSREVRESLARSRNMPAAVYEELAREVPTGNISRLLAENEAVPVGVLETFAATGDRSLKFTLLRNKQLSQESHRRLVRELAANATTKELGALAHDPDAPTEFLARCMEDLDYHVRSGVALNPGATEDMLVRLANDYSSWTAGDAREALAKRFPAALLRITPELVPLDSLDGDVTLNTRFQKAMERSDLKEMTRLADYLRERNELTSILSFAATNLVKTYRPEIMDLFLAYDYGKNPTALAQLAGQCGGDQRWLVYFKTHGAFEKNYAAHAYQEALKNGRLENLAGLIEAKVDMNQSGNLGATALHVAVARRNLTAVEMLLRAGAKTDIPDQRNLTALDYAVMSKLIPAIKIMDKEDRHAAMVETFTKEFPAAPKSQFVGQWTNGADGFSTVSVRLEPDATGLFSVSLFAGLIAWRETSAHEAVAYTFNAQGELERSAAFKLSLNPEGTHLLLEPPKGEKQRMRRENR